MGKPLTKPDLQAFLEWENEQPDRHEFHQGEIFALVGARRVHNEVTGNLYAALKHRLPGSACRVFIETMKLKISDETLLYPDVFVTCDPADLQTKQVFTAPTLVIEVLSPSTQSYDRGAKFTLYRSLASLQEYVLVDPDTREVQRFHRGADGLFDVHDLSGFEQIEFTSIGCTVPAAEVFEGVEPEPNGSAG